MGLEDLDFEPIFALEQSLYEESKRQESPEYKTRLLQLEAYKEQAKQRQNYRNNIIPALSNKTRMIYMEPFSQLMSDGRYGEAMMVYGQFRSEFGFEDSASDLAKMQSLGGSVSTQASIQAHMQSRAWMTDNVPVIRQFNNIATMQVNQAIPALARNILTDKPEEFWKTHNQHMSIRDVYNAAINGTDKDSNAYADWLVSKANPGRKDDVAGFLGRVYVDDPMYFDDKKPRALNPNDAEYKSYVSRKSRYNEMVANGEADNEWHALSMDQAWLTELKKRQEINPLYTMDQLKADEKDRTFQNSMVRASASILARNDLTEKQTRDLYFNLTNTLAWASNKKSDEQMIADAVKNVQAQAAGSKLTDAERQELTDLAVSIEEDKRVFVNGVKGWLDNLPEEERKKYAYWNNVSENQLAFSMFIKGGISSLETKRTAANQDGNYELASKLDIQREKLKEISDWTSPDRTDPERIKGTYQVVRQKGDEIPRPWELGPFTANRAVERSTLAESTNAIWIEGLPDNKFWGGTKRTINGKVVEGHWIIPLTEGAYRGAKIKEAYQTLARPNSTLRQRSMAENTIRSILKNADMTANEITSLGRQEYNRGILRFKQKADRMNELMNKGQGQAGQLTGETIVRDSNGNPYQIKNYKIYTKAPEDRAVEMRGQDIKLDIAQTKAASSGFGIPSVRSSSTLAGLASNTADPVSVVVENAMASNPTMSEEEVVKELVRQGTLSLAE